MYSITPNVALLKCVLYSTFRLKKTGAGRGLQSENYSRRGANPFVAASSTSTFCGEVVDFVLLNRKALTYGLYVTDLQPAGY